MRDPDPSRPTPLQYHRPPDPRPPMTWQVAFRGLRATFYFGFFATLCAWFVYACVSDLLRGDPGLLVGLPLPGLFLAILLVKTCRSMIAIWRRETDELLL